MARWALAFAGAPLIVSVALNQLPLDTGGAMAASATGILICAAATSAAFICSIAAIRTCSPPPPLALIALGSAATLTIWAVVFIVANTLKLVG